jgi:hypothetical protein
MGDLDPLTVLFLYMAAMFCGAFGSGIIPLSFSMSESRLRLVTIFGAGLLVGTALVVIIPEGIAMHYESQLEAARAGGGGGAHAHGRRLTDAVDAHSGHSHGSEEESSHIERGGGHWQIGAALALGFAFQLVVGAYNTLAHSLWRFSLFFLLFFSLLSHHHDFSLPPPLSLSPSFPQTAFLVDFIHTATA